MSDEESPMKAPAKAVMPIPPVIKNRLSLKTMLAAEQRRKAMEFYTTGPGSQLNLENEEQLGKV